MNNRFIITIPYTIEHFQSSNHYGFIRYDGVKFLQLYYEVNDDNFTFTYVMRTSNAPFTQLSETDLCYILEHVLTNFDKPFKVINFNSVIKLPEIGEFEFNGFKFLQEGNRFLKESEKINLNIGYNFKLKLFTGENEVTISVKHISNELFLSVLNLGDNSKPFLTVKELVVLVSSLETVFKFDCINIGKNIFNDGYFDPQIIGFRNYKTVSDYVHFYDRIKI